MRTCEIAGTASAKLWMRRTISCLVMHFMVASSPELSLALRPCRSPVVSEATTTVEAIGARTARPKTEAVLVIFMA
jgi:hypothetical protein